MKIWNDFLDALEKELGKAAVDRWLRPLEVVDFDALNLYLKAQDAFQVVWFDKEIRALAKQRFINERGRPIKIHIHSADLLKKEKNSKPQEHPPTYSSSPLDPHCTFETFLPCEENKLLLQFLRQLKPGFENPLFLFGSEGVGKTHLLMALASHFISLGKKVFFAHTETFTEHVVGAIRNGNVEPLRRTYRHVDVLLLDDIHNLSRKWATQEEFFHTFNSLHGRGCQIILASQCPASRMVDIEPRLISRFEWGISFEIYPPSPAHLSKILQKRAQVLQLPLSADAENEILSLFNYQPKATLRALDALALRSPKRTLTITAFDVHERLADLIKQEKAEAITPEKIIEKVSHHFGLRPDDLTGKSQTKEATLPRQIAIFLCRQDLHLPYLGIGRLFNRDHSTIMASVRLIEKKKSVEPEVARALFELRETLKS